MSLGVIATLPVTVSGRRGNLGSRHMTTFFVGGSMRSGTSLLTSILCSDPSTNPLINEVQYLTRMVQSYRWGKRYFNAYLSDTFETQDDFRQFSQDCIGNYLNRTQERFSPCTHLVLNNPEMTPLFPEVDELVDDARFLVIIRDPRDTIASMNEVAKKLRKAGQGTNLTNMQNDMKQLSSHYKSYFDRLLSKDFTNLRKEIMFLKYENLVLNVSGTVEKIAQFTTLPLTEFDPDADWLRSSRAYEQQNADPFFAPWRTELRGKPISSQGIGRFRERLTHDQVAMIEHECADLLRRFGYQATTGPS